MWPHCSPRQEDPAVCALRRRRDARPAPGELLGLRWTDLDLVRGNPDRRADRPARRRPARRRRHQVRGIEQHGPAAHDHPAASCWGTGTGRREGARRRREVWHEHGLVSPTGVGTPMEPRSLNRHFDGIRTRVACRASGCTTSGTPSCCCWSWAHHRTSCRPSRRAAMPHQPRRRARGAGQDRPGGRVSPTSGVLRLGSALMEEQPPRPAVAASPYRAAHGGTFRLVRAVRQQDDVWASRVAAMSSVTGSGASCVLIMSRIDSRSQTRPEAPNSWNSGSSPADSSREWRTAGLWSRGSLATMWAMSGSSLAKVTRSPCGRCIATRFRRRCAPVATYRGSSRGARSSAPLLTWSGWRDLNPRPLAPKASALPSCATPRRRECRPPRCGAASEYHVLIN
jgi:hypothetical protein